MNLQGCEITVIGAGIGGLAAATALAQRHASVRVLERAPALAEVGSGIQIGPNGISVLEALGLRSAVERVATVPEAIELRDFRNERSVARLPLGRACVARYGRPYWQIHRADLLAVLAEGAAEAGVEVQLDTTIHDVSLEHERPQVRTEAGEISTSDVVIAADGARSATRTAHFSGHTPRFTGHVAWRGLVEAARLPPGAIPDGARLIMGPGRHLVSYPLRNGSFVNFVAVEERGGWAEESWTMPDDPETLRAAFGGWDTASTALLGAVDETFVWGLFDHQPLPTWVQGRLALLGDAGHPMLPFLAQGAAMALEDAWVLAAELDVAETPERGLMAYEARRAPRAGRVQRAAARNGRVYHLRAAEGRGVAQAGLRAASMVAPKLLMGRFDWLYGADVVSAQATV